MTNERTFKKSKLLAMAIGTFVGSGLVSMSGAAAEATGYYVWLAYIAAVVIGFLGSLPLIGITSVMNFTGGSYSIATTFLGKKVGGAYVLINVLNALILAIIGISFGKYVNGVFPAVNAKLCGIVIICLFMVIHCLGVEVMSGIQKYSTLILVIALGVFSIYAFSRLNPLALDFSGTEFYSQGSKGFYAAVIMVIFSCCTYDDNVVVFGRYTINPRKNMPWAIIATFLALIVIYGGCILAQVGAVDLAALSGQPLTVIAKQILPGGLFIAFIILGPIMCLITTINGIFAASTVTIVKSCEDGWLPKSLSVPNKKGVQWKVPLLLGVICLVFMIFNVSMGDLSSMVALIINVLQIPLTIAMWSLPDKFSEEFKNNSLHMSAGVYRATVVIALVVRCFLVYLSFASLSMVVAIGSIILTVIAFVFSLLRFRSGKVEVEQTYFFD